jgi:hypothetical protein
MRTALIFLMFYALLAAYTGTNTAHARAILSKDDASHGKMAFKYAKKVRLEASGILCS